MLLVSHLINHKKSFIKLLFIFFSIHVFPIACRGKKGQFTSSSEKIFLKPDHPAAAIANTFYVYSTFHFEQSPKCFVDSKYRDYFPHATEILYQQCCTEVALGEGAGNNLSTFEALALM